MSPDELWETEEWFGGLWGLTFLLLPRRLKKTPLAPRILFAELTLTASPPRIERLSR